MTTRKILIAATLALLATSTATFAYDSEFTKERIAKLPQDKVQVIKRECARRWPDNFSVRLACEDSEYEALQQLIDRGSVQESAQANDAVKRGKINPQNRIGTAKEIWAREPDTLNDDTLVWAFAATRMAEKGYLSLEQMWRGWHEYENANWGDKLSPDDRDLMEDAVNDWKAEFFGSEQE
jgi:hypothetical protein